MKKISLKGIAVVVFICSIIVIAGYLLVSWRKQAMVSQDRLVYEEALALLGQGKGDEALACWKVLGAKFPDSEYADEALIYIGDFYQKEKKLFEARDSYEKVATDYPNSSSIRLAQQKLWDAKLKILFSPLAASDSTIYTVKPGDTLASIAKRFNTTVDLIMKSNDLSSSLIHPGVELKVSTAKYSLIVDKSRNTLTLKSNEGVLKVYTVSTGDLENPTPSGRFIIEAKLVNPSWRNIPPGDSRNILGSRWMGFQAPFKDYGIHGTTDPASIGKHITKGCIRMLDDDVKEIFTIVPVGSEVIIVD